jgi:IS4 transposase
LPRDVAIASVFFEAEANLMRWQIEVFFKTIKQNLKVKTFIGVSENAFRIQIWTALIALLVIKWLHTFRRRGGPSRTS